jgi:hypothetical protein
LSTIIAVGQVESIALNSLETGSLRAMYVLRRDRGDARSFRPELLLVT